MNTRSRESLVTFRKTFSLRGWDKALPPGTYRIVIDEAAVPDVTFLAYRRVATRMHLPAVEAVAATHCVFDVDAADLDRALAADAA
ncbi:hypothetical protein [Oharaeibacter diazotrophicus]|uniref:Uncharacterized protein n=1 Tax=Oharaeibacter diazotrophicus TaxID=1920512 RepID=A0A4R6REP1_9HYPH|nr:hypothetical protein [Oharaeibacter diazotrophicus]TDP84227.1 hypothetical protein EDD54_2832 [Oharaeibacter diazotrophicus]BBE73265.1 hypothetical protein OHA_1_02874 [Pleomorphomonas sp. SM30]GLS75056.1 hypothetical protein GCM10007904_03910 [Oharaeibacter diazotrophicus]